MHMRGLRQSLCRWGISLIAMIALAGVIRPASGATFYTLATNGPASNRLCLVFLSEGYTNGQAGQFLTDCTNAMNAYFGGGTYTGEEPFVEYSKYFNVYAVFTNSAQSGSDHPATATTRITAFNSTYDAFYDYIITIPSGATGQGLVDGFMTNGSAPWNTGRYKVPAMLVNEPFIAGGSGGLTAIASTGGDFQGILVHESGHVIAGLGDEYPAEASGVDLSMLPAEPNTTTNTSYATIPWKAWIDTNSTPIPTPDDGTYFSSVGLFEGAHYHLTNWYRPKTNCRMRSVSTGIPFCEVCREALVKTFYAKLRGFDAPQPANATVTLTTSQTATFSVAPLQPVTHMLSVQWQTNGTNVPDATNSSFTFDPSAVTNGLYVLRAIVHDDTDWVRNDPTRLLFSTNTWNVTVAVPQLWLESPQSLAGGLFRFTVRGSGVTNFSIKASTNLPAGWTSISTNALSSGLFHFTNSGQANTPGRYYRAVAPPQ